MCFWAGDAFVPKLKLKNRHGEDVFFSPSTSTGRIGQGPREQADSLVNDALTRRMLKIAALHPPSTLSGVQPCIFRNLGHVTELPGEIRRLTQGLFNGRLQYPNASTRTRIFDHFVL
ncbi:hypothetical protein ARMGADRAFT_1089652 [Armillaria gallica]|uniref:Uncharacterized protein n=1 Tax=Armillaria gallica TaxID=47427 RepID=A0A2H3CJ34_ARMGA|nr:hypothetical protein ARMGADRAFT_1089652 [Armillaria gallica]